MLLYIMYDVSVEKKKNKKKKKKKKKKKNQKAFINIESCVLYFNFSKVFFYINDFSFLHTVELQWIEH